MGTNHNLDEVISNQSYGKIRHTFKTIPWELNVISSFIL